MVWVGFEVFEVFVFWVCEWMVCGDVVCIFVVVFEYWEVDDL